MPLHKNSKNIIWFFKALVFSLLVVLPIVGFYLGRMYQQKVDQAFKYQPIKLERSKKEPITSALDINNWKEYKDPSRKFSLNFPQNWLISFSQSGIYKDKSDIKIQGPEGLVEIFWIDSSKIRCQDSEYEKIIIKSGEESFCHLSHIESDYNPAENTELWQLEKQFKINKYSGIYLNFYSFKGTNLNQSSGREIIIGILKSLRLAV